MPTKADVINTALRILGEKQSPGVDETKPHVKRLTNAYESVVQTAFEDHNWNFASEVVLLSAVAATEPGWDYTFNQPANFLRFIKLRPDTSFGDGYDDMAYEVRNGLWLTNSETTYMKFVSKAKMTMPGSWTQQFGNMVAAMLADETYPATDEGNSTRDRIERKMKSYTKAAKSLDGSNKAVYVRPAGNFVHARRRGLSGSRYS